MTYIPGNHDEMFRAWLAMELEVGGIELRPEATHVTADGRRLLVMHGDQFDSVVRYAKLLALLGDSAYDWRCRPTAGSTSCAAGWASHTGRCPPVAEAPVKDAVKFIDRFEEAVAAEAQATRLRRRGVRPHPPRRDAQVGGILYLNDGDWVESCTALVEHDDGRLELLDWAALNQLSFFSRPGETAVPQPALGPSLPTPHR